MINLNEATSPKRSATAPLTQTGVLRSAMVARLGWVVVVVGVVVGSSLVQYEVKHYSKVINIRGVSNFPSVAELN